MTFATKTFSVATPTAGRGRVRRYSGALSALAGVALAVAPGQAAAQRQQPAQITTIDSVRSDGTVKAVPIPTNQGFNLFASEDIAGGSLRMTGNFRTGVTNQGGPASENQGTQFINNHLYLIGGGLRYAFFEMGFVAGAPPTEFRKIRAVHPGINAMAGSLGYTTHYWQVLVPPQIRRIGAADGQFGKAFAGATATFNSSCRDDPRFLLQGFSLLAMKDCPETWGSQGFAAKLVIPDSVWLNSFAANKANFRFDDWKISKSRLDPANTLGTQSLYGFMSDYYREQKLRWGSVVPGGSGAPSDPGYPLGLELRIDSWQLAAPATRNTQFYQVQMVNKSADVYGTGIDYDSLYFGLGPGFLMNGTGGQNASVYFDWSREHAVRDEGQHVGQLLGHVSPGLRQCRDAGVPEHDRIRRGRLHHHAAQVAPRRHAQQAVQQSDQPVLQPQQLAGRRHDHLQPCEGEFVRPDVAEHQPLDAVGLRHDLVHRGQLPRRAQSFRPHAGQLRAAVPARGVERHVSRRWRTPSSTSSSRATR